MTAYTGTYRIHIGIIAGLMALVMMGSGCGLSRSNSADMAAAAQALNNNQTPQSMLAQAEESMKTAHGEALDYYAPAFLSEAEKHLKKAQSLMIKGGDDVAVAAEAMAVRKAIAQGLIIKQTVVRQLTDVFAMKDRLDQLKADVHARDDYDRRMDQIRKLIACIEKGDQAVVDKKKPEALAEMRALEIAVVKKVVLAEARDFLTRARTIDAEKLSPKTWKTAEDTLQRARVFIESFPRDEAGVAQAGEEALLACQHAYFVTREVITIKSLDKNAVENLVLDIETMLDRVRLGLNHGDVRHMSLHDQSVALAGAAETLNRQLASCSRAPLNVAASPSPTAEPVASPDLPVSPVEPAPTDEPALADDLQPLPDEGHETVTTETTTTETLVSAPPVIDDAAPAQVEGESEDLDPAAASLDDLYMTDEEREQRSQKAAPSAVPVIALPTLPEDANPPAAPQTAEPTEIDSPTSSDPSTDTMSLPDPPTPAPLLNHPAASETPAATVPTSS